MARLKAFPTPETSQNARLLEARVGPIVRLSTPRTARDGEPRFEPHGAASEGGVEVAKERRPEIRPPRPPSLSGCGRPALQDKKKTKLGALSGAHGAPPPRGLTFFE